VTGTDVKEIFPTDRVLARLGITVEKDFATNLLDNSYDLVVRSTAFKENHEAVKKAFKLGYQVKTYPEVLSELIKSSYGIAVAGSHGKTTTTAMLGLILIEAGCDPTVILGSEVPQFQSNARVGHSKYLVVEADEYQNKFLDYQVQAAIITNIDYDHPDFFPTPKGYHDVFKKFVEQMPQNGILVYCHEDDNLLNIIKQAKCKIISYGWSDRCDWQVKNWHYHDKKACFKVFYQQKEYGDFALQVPGEHNVLNALACVALAYELGCDQKKIIAGLAGFQGTVRRFEKIGEHHGALIIDDFAHHPTEIKATLKAARDLYPKKKIWCIFHPHTYSRTKALLSEFSQAFIDADCVVILDIFGSAREQQGGVHAQDLVKLIKEQGQEAYYWPTIEEAREFIKNKLGPSEVLITMGAGEAWKIGRSL
jgi:UDP-N-acetylmuramate--alanine ligase